MKLITFLVISVAAVFASTLEAHSGDNRLRIFHFDVNVGDATLIVTPEGQGVLIDAGDRGRGKNPIMQFMDSAKREGLLSELALTIATHYDADHIGGMDEVLRTSWYPTEAALDRGDSFLPKFDEDYVEDSCSKIADVTHAKNLANWGTAEHCSRRASCQIVEYMVAAEEGGRRLTATPGMRIELDHDVVVEVVVVNAKNSSGEEVDVYFAGRRADCAANDLSLGVLVSFGDFRYFVGGDLTGNESEDVANVESLTKPFVDDLDIYHVNHHGSKTSSEPSFVSSMDATVAVVSNGNDYCHPAKSVMDVVSDGGNTKLYLTNKNPQTCSWRENLGRFADLDYVGFDGMIEVHVWRRSFRVFTRREGEIVGNDRYFIKRR